MDSKLIYLALYNLCRKTSAICHIIIEKLWYIPIFKSKCHMVGKNLILPEGIPAIAGHSQITIGNKVTIHKISIVSSRILDNPILTIGDNSIIKAGYTNIGVNIAINIGKNCIINENVFVTDSDGHPLNSKLRRELKLVARKTLKAVQIENNVYVGRNVSILKGVTIGRYSIILPNSLVAKDIPQNSVACGVPATVIKTQHPETDKKNE